MKNICTSTKRFLNIPRENGVFFHIIPFFLPFVKRQKECGSTLLPQNGSLLVEGLAVRTPVFRGIEFVGTHKDPIQRAVVFAVAMVCALLHGTFNTLIGMAIHTVSLLFSSSCLACPSEVTLFREFFPFFSAGFRTAPSLAFPGGMWYYENTGKEMQ